jgi:hypothetical protein
MLETFNKGVTVSDNAIYDIERENLETHVTLCAERYRRLEDKFAVLEVRLDNVASEISALKTKQAEDMNEIKKLIQNSGDIRFKALIAASGTIIAALISALAYILTKHA